MTRRWALALVVLAACGDAGQGTFAILHFEQRGALGSATRIHVRASLGGRVADEDFSLTAAKPLSDGLIATLQIERGEGPITVVATAFAGDTQLEAVSASGDIVRDQSISLFFCFGPGCGDGGVVIDSGPDAAAIDGQAADAQDIDAGSDPADAGSAVLAIDPGSKDFGSIVTNMAGSDVTFTISNTGSATTGQQLVVRKVGTDRTDFAISDDSCNGTTLTTAGTCTVTLAFTPRSAGAKTATLEIAAGPTIASAVLSGTGLAPANLAINPASQGFPDTQLGSASTDATFTVRNTGLMPTGALTATISPTGSDFVISPGCGAPLEPATSCTINVHFQPQQSGDRSASLVVSDSSGSTAAALSGKGLAPPMLAMLPAVQDFGSATIGSQTGSTDFTLRNLGGVPASVPAVSLDDATDYEVLTNGCGAPLAPNATCIISIRFTPTAPPGAKPATLTVSASQGGDAAAQLKGDALAPSSLTILPSTPQAFGSAAIGTTSAETVLTVSNTGGSPTGLPAVLLSGNDPGSFTVSSNTCTAVLAPQASCTVGVSFAPAAVGTKAASVSVTAAPGGVAAVSLGGTGTAQLTVVKAGSGGGTVTSTSSAGINCGATCAAVFATPTVTLAAAPDASSVLTSWSGGGCSGTGACVVSLDMAASVTATFSITPPALSLAPLSQDFGNVTVGASATTTFTLSNSGGSASGAVSSLVSDVTNYTITGGTCGGAVAAGASCTIVVRFNPSGAAGPRPATLTVTANPGGSPTASLTGSALTAGQLTLMPAAKDFGTMGLGTMSAETLFTVTNSGGSTTGAVGVPSVSDAANFAVSSNTCSGTLAPGATCFVGVRFAPSSVGPKQGVSLTVSANPGGSAAATLQGTGSAQLSIGDEGGGTVTSSPAGINCMSPCVASFTSSPVTLTATPDSTHNFAGWNGACSGNGPCSVTLDAPSKNVNAMFVPTIQANVAVVGFDVPDPVPNTQNITYNLTVGNYGPNTATNVTVVNSLPGAVIYVSGTSPSGTCSLSGSAVTCSLGSMLSGSNTTITITVTAKATGNATNFQTVTASEFDPFFGDNSSSQTTLVTNASDLVVNSLTDAPDPIAVGGTILYSVSVRNSGPDPASGVQLTDVLPAGMTFVSATSIPGSCGRSNQTVTCNLGLMAPNASGSATIRAIPTAPGSVSNTVNLTSNSVDLMMMNNTATATTTVN